MLVVVLWLPEVGLERGLKALLTIDDPRGEGTCVVESDRAVLGGCHQIVAIWLCHGLPAGKGGEELFGLQDELLTGDDEALRGPGRGLAQTGIDVEDELGVVVGEVGIGDLEPSVVDPGELARHQFTVMIDLEVVFVCVNGGEGIAVDDADEGIALLHELDGLIDVLRLVVMGMERAVGGDETVDAEWSVVGLVAKVAAIEVIDLMTIYYLTIYVKTLVHPVPDGGAGNA
jgi:hypothetical protein